MTRRKLRCDEPKYPTAMDCDACRFIVGFGMLDLYQCGDEGYVMTGSKRAKKLLETIDIGSTLDLGPRSYDISARPEGLTSLVEHYPDYAPLVAAIKIKGHLT